MASGMKEYNILKNPLKSDRFQQKFNHGKLKIMYSKSRNWQL